MPIPQNNELIVYFYIVFGRDLPSMFASILEGTSALICEEGPPARLGLTPNQFQGFNPLTPRRTLVAPFTKISILF